MEIVVDKMHFKGHVGDWCKRNCNPNNYLELEEVHVCNVKTQSVIMITIVPCAYIMQVDTEVCEQTFSWLSRYARITKHMNKSHFLFFLLYVCELHNRKRIVSL